VATRMMAASACGSQDMRLATILCFLLSACSARSESIRIAYLDVGQGDAALITTPDGKRILVDAGSSGARIVGLLRAEGVDTVDLVIASHNHADHIGGMAGVFEAFVVRAYLQVVEEHSTLTHRRTADAVFREPDLKTVPTRDTAIAFGKTRVRVIVPKSRRSAGNDGSLGVIIEYGQFRALWTGDSELPEIRAWLQQGIIPAATVVKVPHHGAANGTPADLVAATKPKLAIISVGSRNAYGHPAASVIDMWKQEGATTYRTDRDGTISVRGFSDGTASVSRSRGQLPR
jgi:competence protein ComEC